MSGTALDTAGDPPAPPPADASNHPSDIASGVPREASLATLLAVAEAAEPAVAEEQPAEGATGPSPPEGEGEGSSGASGPAEGASGATGAEPTETVDEILARDNTPRWMKKTITEERNRRREAEAAAKTAADNNAAMQKRIDEALAKIAELTPPPAPPKPASPPPMREQFTSPQEYDAAITAWGDATAKAAADQALATAQAKAKADADAAATAAQEARTAADMKALQDGYRSRRDAAMARYPDFEAVAEADTTRVDVPSALAIARADNGPDVLYHLGKNPTEAARIAALSPPEQVFEIGRLSATLAQPARPAVSKAPAPLRPITATRETATDANREETMDEVAARVRKRDTWRASLPGAAAH